MRGKGRGGRERGGEERGGEMDDDVVWGCDQRWAFAEQEKNAHGQFKPKTAQPKKLW